MDIQHHIPLQAYNTFGIAVHAEQLATVQTTADVQEVLRYKMPQLILGGGSNLLFTRDIEGLVLFNAIRGIRCIAETTDTVIVQFGAGEVWHECVQWCIQQQFGGIENLSLIPGTVGAAPIQNIGAYGVELAEVFHSLEAVHLATNERHQFSRSDCQFGYRNSIFKNQLKGQYCITAVNLQLTKHQHRYELSYGALRNTLAELDHTSSQLQAISEAVIRIRTSKLPNPQQIGNAGSFFKNPELPSSQFAEIKKKHPNIVSYPLADGRVKVPAGWLIEHCGWKGRRLGQAGSYAHQALVLVNHGGATGMEILQLARTIQHDVQARFGIELTPEVNIF